MLTTTRAQMKRLQLHQQGLLQPHLNHYQDASGVLHILNRLGYVQLDTMNVLSRSQDLFFWSRDHRYQREWLLELYDQQSIFEVYLFALCLLPASSYEHLHHYFAHHYLKMTNQSNIDLLLNIYEQVQVDQPLRSRDIEHDHPSSGATWSMTPARRALDQLWRAGLIKVSRDHHFNKLYTRTEQNIEDHRTIEHEPTLNTYLLDLTFENLGIATLKELKACFNLTKTAVSDYVKQQLEQGHIQRIQIEEFAEEHFIRTQDVPLLTTLEKVEGSAATFLSPFDNMIRDRSRLLKLFDVNYKLESYMPKEQRQYGYFAMPILIGEQIVGVIDLKNDRQRQQLQVQKLTLFDSAQAVQYKPTIESILQQLCVFVEAEQVVPVPEITYLK
ncbi:DNA glycosylase AlkZ-like family protein [Paenibacillus nicotianae]|uniref:DNA glycosylase AlkZ-like family protein n=1 Tax=Paenibacillus nicotianae TaxID=1526551 RepID=A0ABW4UNX7_9BACL